MESILKCPVTALHLYKDFILSGQGSKLTIYSKRTHKKIFSTKLFHECRIHKFCQNQYFEDFFIALAGKNVICFSIHSNNDDLSISLQSLEKNFNAWIWDGFWVTHNQVLLVSAHNTALLWSYLSNSIKLIGSCSEQCILYSATITEIENVFWVGVGTVFNKVLLWKVNMNNHKGHYYEDTYKTFIGHEGVIFRVRFHESKKQLLSVSDDRSIRLWSIDDETCLRIMYGHTARVWDAQYLLGNIVSIGEDAVCLLWNREGQIEKKFTGHKGKSIWSLSVTPGLIITGGGDGSIRMLYLQQESVPYNFLLELPTPTVNFLEEQKDFPRFVKIVDENCLLILTNQGKLYKYLQPLCEWILIGTDSRFYSYSCLALVDHVVAIGNLNGLVKILLLDNLHPPTEISAFNGKVYNLLWLKIKKKTFLLVSGPEGETALYSLSLTSLKFEFKFTIPYSRQRWVTAAVLVDISKTMYLICGDRRGSIHLYNTHFEDSVQILLGVHGKTGVTFISCSKDRIFTTGRDGVYQEFKFENDKLNFVNKQKSCKGLDWIEGLWMHKNEIILYGFYMQSYFAAWNPKLNEILFKIKCGGGYRSWDVSFPEQNSDKVFKLLFSYLKGITINYSLYDLSISYQALILEDSLHGKEVNCIKVLGKYLHKGANEWLLAAASEDTTVTLMSYNPREKTIILLHTCVGHIGGVKDISFVLHKQISSALDGFLFSCGSRTSLKCWKLFSDQFLPMNSTSDVMKTYKDVNRNNNQAISCSLVTEIYNPELKKKKEMFRNQEIIDDMRFLSCCTFKLSDVHEEFTAFKEHIVCTCACSDGVARIYLRTELNFQLFLILEFHKHCVQAARHFITKECFVYIYTIATDGHLAVWNITEALSDFVLKMRDNIIETKVHAVNENRFKFHDLCFPFFKNIQPMIFLSVHQSGINALDLFTTLNGQLIVTGGDDNALCVSMFNEKNDTLQLLAKDKHAHFSQITGVKFITEDLIVSTSVDQKVTIWRLDNSSLKRVYEWHVDIADVSCLDCWVESEVVFFALGGIGVQLFSVACSELQK